MEDLFPVPPRLRREERRERHRKQQRCCHRARAVLLLWWGCAGLKKVRLDHGSFYVSNYLREIAIPVGMIERVTENRWINIHPITIHFRCGTEFGDRITFMPKLRLFGSGSSHPVVAELMEEASDYGQQ